MAASLQLDSLRFLAGWNRHANFFQSNEAKVGDFLITPEYELGLGQATPINLPAANDPAGLQYTQRLTARLVAASPGSIGPVVVQIYQGTEFNALTVPGRMFVSAGVLAGVGNEAELAAVVSHELAHLYAHHASRRLIKATRGNAVVNLLQGSLLGRALGNRTSPNAQALTKLAADIGLDLYLKAYERGEEGEADRYATHLLYNAGFPPDAMASLLSRLSDGGGPIGLFNTHPSVKDRVDALEDYVQQFPARAAQNDSADFLSAIKKQGGSVPAAPRTIRADSPPPASALPPVKPPGGH